MKQSLCTLFIFSYIILCTHQIKASDAPPIQWQKTYGDGNNEADAYSIKQTFDGGYIIAGRVYSIATDFDFWIIKTNSTGDITWEKKFGGTHEDTPKEIIQTRDSGYIIIGVTHSNDGDVNDYHGNSLSLDYGDIWVVKLNKEGSLQWKKCYGGSLIEAPTSILQTEDGGYIIAGASDSDDGDVIGGINFHWGCWILKISPVGDILWQKKQSDYLPGLNSIQQTFDKGFILCGIASSDADILKLDSTGNFEWYNLYGGSGVENAKSIVQTPDSGYIFVASSTSSDGDVAKNYGVSDYWIVKINKDGFIQWQKNYGGSGSEEPFAMSTTTDGGLVIAGRTNSGDSDVTGHHRNDDYWVIKIDSAGTLLWEKCLGGDNDENAESVAQTNDGGYIIAGRSWSADGDLNGDGNTGVNRCWIVKLSALTTDIHTFKSTNDKLLVTPNPNNGNFTIDFSSKGDYPITITVFDMTGKVIYQQSLQHNNRSLIQISDVTLASGLYNAQISSNKDIWNKKVMIVK